MITKHAATRNRTRPHALRWPNGQPRTATHAATGNLTRPPTLRSPNGQPRAASHADPCSEAARAGAGGDAVDARGRTDLDSAVKVLDYVFEAAAADAFDGGLDYFFEVAAGDGSAMRADPRGLAARAGVGGDAAHGVIGC